MEKVIDNDRKRRLQELEKEIKDSKSVISVDSLLVCFYFLF